MKENNSALSGLRLGECYVADLYPGEPTRGKGFFGSTDGRLRYYSDGGEWFFEAGTGRPVFRVVEGKIYV
jgi:hypothetical protein